MATNSVVCSYQEIVDLHTEGGHVTVLGIHTPTGDYPKQMFRGFFDQFKKYKYLGCSVALVPAARLPSDPLQVKYNAGEVENTIVDPRDALNPLLFHGCHGDDMGTILNTLYGNDHGISDSVVGIDTFDDGGEHYEANLNELLERLYYKALTDSTWKKAHPQRGFRKSGLRPLIYDLAVNRPLLPGTQITGLSEDMVVGFNDDNVLEQAGGDPYLGIGYTQGSRIVRTNVNKNNLQFFTPRLKGLGWIDTRQPMTIPQEFEVPDGAGLDSIEVMNKMLNTDRINYVELPKIYMGCILLPPAYGVEQYFRMIINHRFAFKQFRGISFKPEVSAVPTYWDSNQDLFDGEHFDPIDDVEGSVDPSPEPEPEPTPTGSYHVFAQVENNAANGRYLVFTTTAYSTGANVPSTTRLPFRYYVEETGVWSDEVTSVLVGGSSGVFSGSIVYVTVPNDSVAYPYFLSGGNLNLGVGTYSPSAPWDSTTSPDVNDIQASYIAG